MTRVLVTGATGFVGSVLCTALTSSGYVVRAALRNDRLVSADIAEKAIVGEIGGATVWDHALTDVDVVVHAAARAHVMDDPADAPDLYVRTNVDGTAKLAQASAQFGVRRFVYLSSVKVNGEATSGVAFTARDVPRPQDAYGASKWQAEKALMHIAERGRMGAVIIRAPLVYGPGVRANFLRLLQWVDREWPLPLGAINNSRSLVSIWNLCDLLVDVVANPAAVGATWMVSDGDDMSTPELIRRIANAMGRPVRLPSVPPWLLHTVAALLGRRAEVARLCGSLVVDASATRRELDWSPPVTVDEALAWTVGWYLARSVKRGA